ncbi:MAG: DNA polymerase III subunit alpha [Bacillota bacterium]|nr:DNA polymerase III subunit alpha [Bacillota bacterium]
MSFIHLQTYSAYTLLTSTASVSDLVKAAKEKGFPCIALTDRNVMYGVMEFFKLCEKAEIKPIIGLTVDVKEEGIETDSYPLVLIAENNRGFKNLLKISSSIQTRAKDGIPLKWLKAYSEGLIAMTPGLEGQIEQLLLEGKESEAKNLIQKLNFFFGQGNFFLTVQNHILEKELVIRNYFSTFSKELDIPLVATNDVHYIEKTDTFIHECLLAIKNGDKLQDEHRERLENNQYYLKTSKEMVESFSEIPEALENTLKIADRCHVSFGLNHLYLPKFPTENNLSADEFLEEQCKKGLRDRISSESNEYIQRLEYELSVIKRMKFSDYFLIVWDFMRYAKQRGILTGPGRGSAAGSLVSYVLHITDVDPIKHQLLFERFLNPERVSMPDIDIDFPDQHRDEMIEYVAKKYGELHVAQIITFGTMAAKGALRDVGRAFGLNSKELDQLSKLIPSQLGMTLETALKESERLKAFVNEAPMNKKLFDTALKLEGLPRHTSTHAAGVIISEKPLVELIPIQEGHNQVYLTQYSMDYLEELGLLKMDFLGLRNLSLIESIVHMIFQETHKKIDLKSILLNDQKTYELLSKGETTGIFQLESEGMRNVLLRLKPNDFEDIVAVNALYRPGPMENIPLYIDRKHQKKPVEYLHADLKPILENTYGVIVYQEQIMQIASKMAGFSLGEADLLRRAVSKKKKEVLDEERNHFVQGALKKGYDIPLANEIYDLIVRFANYGFNRSHAVAYSMIAYQLAYLKANFPVCFMAGLLSSAIGNDVKIAQYIREARQMGIRILPPSINESDFSFKVSKGDIRYSLAAIKGVGATVLRGIFQARKAKKFDDLFDFCLRVPLKVMNRKILEFLVHAGCFDEFGEDRATLLASIDVAIEHALLVKPDESSQIDFFKEEEFLLKPKYVSVDPIRLEDKLACEREALGLYLSNHPVTVYEEKFKSSGITHLYDLLSQKKKGIICVYINALKRIRTKKGQSMAFLIVSDSTDEIESIAFPEVYKNFSNKLVQGKIVVIEGKIEERDGKPQFLIHSVFDPEDWVKRNQQSILYLKITKEKQDSLALQQLKQVLKENKGQTQVVLYYENSRKTVRLANEFNVDGNEKLLITLEELLGSSNVVLRD